MKILDRALQILALAIFASLVVEAWHDVSMAWDGWYYHLPFAARIHGIVGPDAYAFTPLNQARFEGYPLVGEALQGLLWRITGRVECASFFSLAALPALILFLRRTFSVPAASALLALLAIPLVQIHATAAYVDLSANTCATILLLIVYRQLVETKPPSVPQMVFAAGIAAAAANMKFQLVPVVVAASLALVFTAWRRDAKRPARFAVILCALPVVFATPIKNMWLHGNPVWPVELHLFGRSLPHLEGAYSSSPEWLMTAARPIRWVASIFELGLRPLSSHARWSIDQWTPPHESGYRMGGFFGAYVALNIGGLFLAVLLRKNRESRVALFVFSCATFLASLMPQSHELRYYMFWMLLLVSLNMILWRSHRGSIGVLAAMTFAVVAWSTEGTYLYPSGQSFASLLSHKVDRAALEKIPAGERVCISRSPWTFLYAPTFHSGRLYTVQEAEEPADCRGARPLD